MSVHSLNTLDHSYKGYEIDNQGEVTEIYDHRDTSLAPSSIHAPLVESRIHPPPVARAPVPQQRPPNKRNPQTKRGGCCDSCVNVLVACGNLRISTAFSIICILAGVAMFTIGGIISLNGTLDLFRKYGPTQGNPGTDPEPQYVYTPHDNNVLPHENFQLRDLSNLGNRVPQVFQSIQTAIYVIAPFMVLFTLIITCDNHSSARNLKRKTSQKTSTGLCCTSTIVAFSYILVLFWIITACFTTLGIYYYRIVMLRCYDMYERDFPEGAFQNICIDLVQIGLIMFRDTTDEGFGKICGPGDNMKTFGRLDEYCANYYPIFQTFLITFAGCLLIVIGLMNFMLTMSTSQGALNQKRLQKNRNPPSVATYPASIPSTARTDLPPSIPAGSALPPVRRSSREWDDGFARSRDDRVYKSSRDLLERRRSRFDDIEMEERRSLDGRRYLEDDRRSLGGRRYLEEDSNAGVNYYYRR